MLFTLFIAEHSVFAGEIVTGSWNIQGNGGTFDEAALIEFGTEFVCDKNIDILALQEVKVPLKKLPHTTLYKTRLGNDFLDRFAAQLEKQTDSVRKFVSSCDYSIRENIYEYAYCNSGLDNDEPFSKSLKHWKNTGRLKCCTLSSVG